jgi:hypothetical protein
MKFRDTCEVNSLWSDLENRYNSTSRLQELREPTKHQLRLPTVGANLQRNFQMAEVSLQGITDHYVI